MKLKLKSYQSILTVVAVMCLALVFAFPVGGASAVQLDLNTRMANLETALFGNIQTSTNIPTAGVQWTTQETVVTLTAAQVDTMYTTPIAIVPSPGAGYGVAVEKMVITPQAGATVFGSGGAVHLYYTGGSTDAIAGSLAASVMTNLAAYASSNSSIGTVTATLTIPSATGVSLTNLTGVFTGSGTLKVHVFWKRFTL